MQYLILTVAFMIAAPGPPALSHGPFVGHVTTEAVSIWARGAVAGDYLLYVAPTGTTDWIEATATATADDDLTLVLTRSGLSPGTSYDYAVVPAGAQPSPDDLASFATAPPEDSPALVTLAFGSCANENPGTQAVWNRMGTIDPDVVVLLGDTPYIDTTDLAVQRLRYREFAAVDAMAAVLATTPWYGTWDDHDFGLNDTDGNLPGKENARRTFVEYHANPSCGAGEAGIYTSFRHGPVEVFLLDTRWFAATGPSPAAGDHPTLLGAAQWHWLLRGLSDSDAPFKIVASGMIWNKAVRPNKTDHWATYRRERDALFRFIGDADVSGVVLVGGDIHRSRVVRHPVAALAGYELTELITSPMHASIIGAANAPHPGLVWDGGVPHAFLLLSADTTRKPAVLTAEFLDAAGTVLHVETLDAGDLGAAPRP